jgi:hypothetical protein
MLIRARITISTTAAFALALAASARADDAKLRYTYSSEPVVYRIVVKGTNEMSGGFFGAGMKGGLATSALCQFKKVGSEGDSSKIEFVYKGIKFRQDTPGGKSVYFDSSDAEFRDAKPDSMSAMQQMMKAVLDKPILLTIDPRGQVTKVENMKPILDAVKAAGGGDQLGEATIETVIKEERMMRMFRVLFPEMPEGAVKKGSAWDGTFTDTEQLVGKTKQTTMWTYAGDETLDKHAVVHLKADMKIEAVEDKERESKRPAGSKLEMDKDAKGASDVMFDPKAGMVRTATFSNNIPISMSINAENKALAMNMRFTNSDTATIVAAGAPIDPDNAVTKPDAAATDRSKSVKMQPLTPKEEPKEPAKDQPKAP